MAYHLLYVLVTLTEDSTVIVKVVKEGKHAARLGSLWVATNLVSQGWRLLGNCGAACWVPEDCIVKATPREIATYKREREIC